jgi:hypothetical protein
MAERVPREEVEGDMGIQVTATEAARLVDRSERTIRTWISSGRLPAVPAGLREPGERTGPTRWAIDVEDLARIPGVTLNGAVLAELEVRARLSAQARAQGGESILERLAHLESLVAALMERVEQLEGQPAASSAEEQMKSEHE